MTIGRASRVSRSNDRTITATDENADVKIAYRITLDADNSATTDFSYALKRDLPAEIEYAAGFVNGPLLADAPYTAQTAGGIALRGRAVHAAGVRPGKQPVRAVVPNAHTRTRGWGR